MTTLKKFSVNPVLSLRRSKALHHRLAVLGEDFQDTGNGQLRVTTHGGLVVTLTIRERHPCVEAQDLLIRIVATARKKQGFLPSNPDSPRRRFERMLLQRRLIEVPKGGIFNLMRATKAGKIAAARFLAMRPLLQRRAVRAKAKAAP